MQAACGARAPTLEASPAQAAPDEPFRLRGEGFFGDFICNDTGTVGDPIEPSRPLPDESIPVEFVQGDRTWPLATVGSNEDLSFDVGLAVPADARPGRAVVRATGSLSGPTETPFLVLDALPETGGPWGTTPSG